MIRSLYLQILLFTILVCLIEINAQTYELRGSLRQWVKVFSNDPNEVDLSESRIKLELLSTFGENTAFSSRFYYAYDGMNKRGEWDLQEAYLDYYSDLVDIRFGKQVISWGKADELNPTDILNPQNLSNITEDKAIRKFGLMSLKTDWKFYDFILEGIWKLEFQSMQLPSLNSRWSFFSLPGVSELPSLSFPESKLENTEWALKLYRTIELFDFSISYFDGWDNIFTPNLIFNPVAQHMELDQLVFHRTKMIGADFAGSLESVGVWGEFAYFHTEDSEGNDPFIKNPYLQFVLGADYTYGYNIETNLQYFQQYITKIDNDTEEEIEENNISKLGLGMPLQQAASIRIKKKFGDWETNSVELFGIYDIKHKGIMIQPKLIISPEDAFLVELGLIIFEGDEQSLFGRFDDNDQIYMKGTYSF